MIDGTSREGAAQYAERHFYGKGLIYLNSYGNDDNVIMHIWDVDGELARIYGKGTKGGVWFANAWDQIHEVVDKYTTDCWQQVKSGTAHDEGGSPVNVRLDVSPVCVASSLELFFEAFAATGKPPSHMTGPGGRVTPNAACLWLDGKEISTEKFEVKLVTSAHIDQGYGVNMRSLVSMIMPNGALAKWNADHPEAAVKIGDKRLHASEVVEGDCTITTVTFGRDKIVPRSDAKKPRSRLASFGQLCSGVCDRQ